MKNVLGRFSYFLEGAKDLSDIHAEHKIIEANGEHFEGDYIFGAISNSKSIGGLVKYDDNTVDFGDGLLEMMLIKKPDNIANLCSVLHSLNHKEYDNPYIDFCRADKFIIKSQDESDWTLDGEFAHAGNEIVISCIKEKINFIAPKSSK
jgi:diacylglycerol kinase family enzyme